MPTTLEDKIGPQFVFTDTPPTPMQNERPGQPCQDLDDVQLAHSSPCPKGERGKYYHAYRQSHSVKIHEEDGTMTVQYFSLEDGAVMLEPDVREYFPNSESVNQALRTLISLIPQKPAKRTATSKARKGNAKF